MYKQFIKIVNGFKPKHFVMENVKGILPFKDEIVKDFNDIGYNVEVKLIKGEEIGMKQKRHRVFFIGEITDNIQENKKFIEEEQATL